MLIGPTGIAGWIWYRAEIALARAAADAGIPFTLASTSSTTMETVLAEGGGTQWYQLYAWRDAEAALVTVARARDAGFEALVLTVDSPTYNNREFDIRNGANFPPRVTLRSAIDGLSHPRWLFGTLVRYVLAEGRLPRFPNIHFPPAAAGAKNYTAGQGAGFLSRSDTVLAQNTERSRKPSDFRATAILSWAWSQFFPRSFPCSRSAFAAAPPWSLSSSPCDIR